jgi:hypothetical protein
MPLPNYAISVIIDVFLNADRYLNESGIFNTKWLQVVLNEIG